MKPYLISHENPNKAYELARKLGLKTPNADFIWIPLLPEDREWRKRRLKGRNGYTRDKLIGYFTEEEIEELLDNRKGE